LNDDAEDDVDEFELDDEDGNNESLDIENNSDTSSSDDELGNLDNFVFDLSDGASNL